MFAYVETQKKIVTLKPGISFRTLTFQKKCYLRPLKPFKNDEKCFLFHFKSYFRPQDIKVFVMTFCSCRIMGLIRKILNFKIRDVTT